MDHYETLGVPRDADEAAIRKGFRAMAAKWHPDRAKSDDGSIEGLGRAQSQCHDAMAMVNQAYAVLSDPERRKRYDETGQDKAGPSIEDQARSVLAQIFTQALEGDRNIVIFSRETLGQVQAAAKNQLNQHLAQVAALQSRRDKVRTAGGEVNMVHAIIDGKLVQLNAAARQVEKHIEVLAAAERQLDAYESDERSMPVYMPVYMPSMASATTTGTWR